MTSNAKALRFPFAIAFLFGTAAYAFFFRKLMLKWGATDEEAARPLPGDSLVSKPNYQSTHAVTVLSASKKVWPWIVQIGYQRGGFYSYDWLERQAGLVGLHSADEIVPAWQELHPGDTVLLSPVTPMKAAVLEPERAFVLHTVMNPFTAQVADSPLQPETPYIDWSWAFILEPLSTDRTRLLVRVRAKIHPHLLGKALSWLVLEPVHFLMELKMLEGLRTRAEAAKTHSELSGKKQFLSRVQ
jgi:hypothetical protein